MNFCFLGTFCFVSFRSIYCASYIMEFAYIIAPASEVVAPGRHCRRHHPR